MPKKSSGNYVRKSFGEKRGGKGNLRKNKEQRKKGQPKWKNVFQEIDGLNTRILQETPPSGILYYKYKPSNEDENDERKDEEELKETMA